MLKNYIKIALRQLSRNAIFSFINIIGLAIGLACFMLIASYVYFELSYDNFHEKGDHIFRLTSKARWNGEMHEFSTTPTAAYPTFHREFPEVESGVRIANYSSIVRYKDKLFEEDQFFYADSSFFEMFSFEVERGNPTTMLDDIGNVVITASMAEKYFGDKDPINEVIRVGSGERELQVVGVVADPPANSQIKFNFVAPFHALENWRREIWGSANFITYLQLSTPDAAPELERKIRTYMDEVMGEGDSGDYLTYVLQPMRDVHLRARVEGGLEPGSDIRYVYIFSAIALLILIIACINYMNLATARSADRAREVGIRKVVGAERGQLFRQFLGESAVVTFLALLVGIFIAQLLMPIFNQFTNREMPFVFFENGYAMAGLVALGVIVSLIAGIYPALMIAGFKPISVLRGNFKTSGGAVALRRVLVIFQFAVSIFLIVGTIVVQSQLSFIQNRKLGYNKDQLLILPIDSKISARLDRFKTEFQAVPNVKSVTVATESPTFIEGGYSLWAEGYPEDFNMQVVAKAIDKDYIPTLEIEMLAGSNFTEADYKQVNKEDSAEKYYHFLLNESAIQELGWNPEEAIGKRANLNGRVGEIKGVVENFHFASLHHEIRPLVLFIDNVQLWQFLLKVDGEIAPAISALEQKWKALAPHRPFEYHFLDEEFDQLYEAEQRTGSIAAVFAMLAIVIACLGLLGLTAFAAQQRTKEIGIRKVLGASVLDLISLLSKDFLLLVIVSMFIAFPLAWWAMSSWLQDFVYRIDISWWVFALAGFVALAIALFTVASQAVRAARINPADTLRSE